MSFFTGPPDAPDRGGRGAGQGGLGGHDDLARGIAEQARVFGQEFWRWEDMQGYMFRLLLEYVPSLLLVALLCSMFEDDRRSKRIGARKYKLLYAGSGLTEVGTLGYRLMIGKNGHIRKNTSAELACTPNAASISIHDWRSAIVHT
jgi:hypothetical protein